MQRIVAMLEEIFPNATLRQNENIVKVTIIELSLDHMVKLAAKAKEWEHGFPAFNAKVRRSGTQVTLIVNYIP